jgi:hypothetical protein
VREQRRVPGYPWIQRDLLPEADALRAAAVSAERCERVEPAMSAAYVARAQHYRSSGR